MDKKQVKAKLSRILRKAKVGDTINMYANGSLYGTYEVSGWEPDAKTPQEWLNGNLCFASYDGYGNFELEHIAN